MRVENFLRDSFLEEWRFGRERPLVLVFIAMRGDQIAALRRAADGDFASRTAAERTDLFSFGRTVARRLALFTDWTVQTVPLERSQFCRIRRTARKAKRQ